MRLLIAEDNREHQKLLLSALTRARPRINACIVANRVEFLRAVREERFACVVLDYNLGPTSAPELLKEAASCLSCTPVVVVSACDEQRVVIESLRNGVADFLPKNEAVEGSTLWDHIEQAVKRAERQNLTRRRTHTRLRALQRAASIDALTGLHNRGYATRVLSSGRLRTDRRARTSCVLLDIDHFKSINDTYGHDAGDGVLRRVAGVLKRLADDGDVLVRWGGEEFLAIKPSASQVHAWGWADALRRSVEQEGTGIAGATIMLAVSVGVVTVPTRDLCEATVALADRALYLAKDHGRNRTCTWPMVRAFEAAEQAQASPRLTVEQRMTRLVESLNDSLGRVQREHIGTHSLLVRDLAVRIGRAMQLSAHNLTVVAHAAWLHDIGKIAVPEDVLAKPAPLTDEERRFVAEHSRAGADIAAALGVTGEVAGVIRGHCERYDGAQAGGSSHSLLARIVTVADAIIAMMTDRPYARRRRLDEALAEVRRYRGRQFDPDVVDTVHFVDCDSLARAA